MRRADRHPKCDFWSWTDRTEVRSAEVTGRPHGRNQVKSWQAHCDLIIFEGSAPQENGPSEHKEHFWDHVTKTLGKASETHVDHFWRRLQRGPHARRCGDRVATPLRDAHRQRSAHQRDLRSGAALEPSHMVCETCAGEPGLGRK